MLGFSALIFQGEDAATFLQGQITQDVRLLQTDSALLAAYCSPKGRMLASFVLFKGAQNQIIALVRADIAEQVAKRLRMYVMRAKCSIWRVPHVALRFEGQWPADFALEPLTDTVNLPVVWADDGQSVEVLFPAPGGCARQARIALEEAVEVAFALPRPAGAAATGTGAPTAAGASSAPNSPEEENAAGTPEPSPEDWDRWQLADIQLGLPWVCAATYEHFIAQAAGFETLGAINFKKGCYTGQEVVARMHYLGKSKRGLFRTRVEPIQSDLAAGSDFPDHGEIVNVASNGTQQWLLYVGMIPKTAE